MDYLKIKRLLDLIFSIILLVVCFPLFIIISILSLVKLGRPIIFTQIRVGENQKNFKLFKFRTMPLQKKERKIVLKRWDKGIPDDFIFKSKKPDNVTNYGLFLRKFSLDELPQIINVIKGEMSLIGPRPEVPEFTKYYNDIQKERLKVKPGLSGYAQVKGRSEITHGDKIKFDRYYVKNISFKMDLKIFIKTIYKVILAKSSY